VRGGASARVRSARAARAGGLGFFTAGSLPVLVVSAHVPHRPDRHASRGRRGRVAARNSYATEPHDLTDCATAAGLQSGPQNAGAGTNRRVRPHALAPGYATEAYDRDGAPRSGTKGQGAVVGLRSAPPIREWCGGRVQRTTARVSARLQGGTPRSRAGGQQTTGLLAVTGVVRIGPGERDELSSDAMTDRARALHGSEHTDGGRHRGLQGPRAIGVRAPVARPAVHTRLDRTCNPQMFTAGVERGSASRADSPFARPDWGMSLRKRQ
jgi:hypothetical protein